MARVGLLSTIHVDGATLLVQQPKTKISSGVENDSLKH